MRTVVIEIEGGPQQGAREIRLDGTAQIGRGPDNELVLSDEEVSWHHAMIYWESDHVWIRDLGSRNGTLVDGQPIKAPERLSERSRVRIGPIDLRIRKPPPRALPLMLEADGVRHKLLTERFVISGEPTADLRVPSVVEPITILVPGNGEVWVGHQGVDEPVELDQLTEVAGFQFTVSEGDPHRQPTVEASGSLYRYALSASLDGGPGPIAAVEDLVGGHRATFTAETRAILLYSLGRQFLEDREAGRDPTETGWVADPDLIIAVWGRTPLNDGLARLKTLVHRVRADCREAGLDPWCVEKRRGYTRIRVETVEL